MADAGAVGAACVILRPADVAVAGAICMVLFRPAADVIVGGALHGFVPISAAQQ